MNTLYNRFTIGAAIILPVLFLSCSTEKMNIEESDNKGYYISVKGKINNEENLSRTHWTVSDKEMIFHWDASYDEMKSMVYSGSSFKQFTAGQYISPTSVTPHETISNNCSLDIEYGLAEDYSDGDIVWSVIPVKNEELTYKDNKAEIIFILPSQYTQTDISTTHLSNYILMSGYGAVNQDKEADLDFTLYPSIYRFRVKNNDTETLNITNVTLSGPFNDKAVLSFNGTETIEYSRNTTDSNYSISVNAEGITIESGQTQDLYALVFPTETSKTDAPITLSYTGKYGNIDVTRSVQKPCNSIYPSTDWVSNKYYIMNVPVTRESINFGSTTVNDFNDGGSFDVPV